MASPSSAKTFKSEEKNESLCGYVHNVSPLKTAVQTCNKYFNAVFQVNHDEFHNVIMFAAEKRASFVQSNKYQIPVILDRIKRTVSEYLFSYVNI